MQWAKNPIIDSIIMTNSFALDKPKRSEGWAKFQEWNRKWNRILASIFCILCFILLFAIVIVNVIETKEIQMDKSSTTSIQILKDYDEIIPTTTSLADNENHDGKINLLSYQAKALDNSCTIASCKVTCGNGWLESVNEEILQVYQNKSSCDTIDLVLTNYNSGNKTLYKDWYKLPYPVDKLEIHRSHFQSFDDYAFYSGQFQGTKHLKLHQLLSLKKLTQNVFAGMESVKEVLFEEFPAITQIDAGVLTPMRTNDESLSIHYMPANFLIGNITGDQSLSYAIISLRYNNFRDTIIKNSFVGLKSVVSLFLEDSKIMSLPSGVFDRLFQLRLIHLTNNLLHTVPSGIFDIVMPNKIYLAKNEFDCVCNEGILYLQEYIRKYPTKIYDDVTCSTPDEVSLKLLKNVELYCEPSTSTSILDTNTPDYHSKNTKTEIYTSHMITSTPIDDNQKSTTEVISTTRSIATTSHPANNLYLNCENHKNITIANYVQPIIIEAQSVEFKIIKDKNFDVFIEFFSEFYSNITLLWFTNHTDGQYSLSADNSAYQLDYAGKIEYKCAENVKRRVEIENLKEHTVYIFCIVDQTDGRVIPFNCAAFRFTCDLSTNDLQNRYGDDVWISKSDKVMAIAIFSASVLLAIISGALIMYCCLRRFPFFVVNKTQQNPNRPWSNERDEIIEYHAPPNYITPTPARRSKTDKNCRPTLNNRRFSETSAGSARSYVSAVTPSPFDIISFRMNNSNNKEKLRMSSMKPDATYDEARDNIMYLEKIPDVPPPLPPHPNRRSNQSNTSSKRSTKSASSNDPLFSISYRVQNDPDHYSANSYA